MKASIPENERERLQALRALRILDTETESAFDDLCLLAAQIFEAPMASITFIDESRQWFKSRIGINATETSRDMAFCAHTILQPDLLIVPDTATDGRFSENPMVTGDPWIRFYAGAPIVLSVGLSVGSVCVVDRKPRRLTPEQQGALRIVRDQVVRLLEARKRETELQQAIANAEKVQRLLHETEQRFFQFLDALPIGVFVIDVDSNPYYANQAAQQMLGRGIVPQAGAEDLADTYQVYIAGTTRPYPAGMMPIIRALAGERSMISDQELHRQNKIIPVQVWGAPIYNHQGQIAYAIAAFIDISDRRRSEQRYQTMIEVTKVLAASSSLAESEVGIARAICESLGWDVGLIWDVDPDKDVLFCADVWHKPSEPFADFVALSRQLRFPRGFGIPGTISNTKEPLWIKDVVEDPNFPRLPAALKSNLHAAFAFPVMNGGELMKVFEFFSREVREPDEDVLAMSKGIATQIEQFRFRKWIEEELRRLGSQNI